MRSFKGSHLTILNILLQRPLFVYLVFHKYLDHIVRIVYCTAIVKQLPGDPQQATHQQFYLRALKTLPNLHVVLGHFEERTAKLRLVPPPRQPPIQLADGTPLDRVLVQRFEEKGSDVNLATHLLIDGFQNLYDVAVVVSADTDLEEPIRLVDVSLRKKVGILTPRSRLSELLVRHADFVKYIISKPSEIAELQRSTQASAQKRLRSALTEADLLACQFPDQMTDADGVFHRPAAWR